MNVKELEKLLELPYQESIPKMAEMFVKDFRLEKEMGEVLAATENLKKEISNLSLGEEAEKALKFAIGKHTFGLSLAILGKKIGILDEQSAGKFLQIVAEGTIKDTFETALPLLTAINIFLNGVK